MADRRSIRLRGWDYGGRGLYFVTVDVQNKLKLFWDIEGQTHGQTHRSACTKMNEIGKMIDYWWNEIGNHFAGAELDEYVVMPDHLHGIIKINDNNIHTLGDIVQWFKTMTTNEYIRGVKNKNWPKFYQRLWQRNYFEKIVWNQNELTKIRKYILNNPVGVDRRVDPNFVVGGTPTTAGRHRFAHTENEK